MSDLPAAAVRRISMDVDLTKVDGVPIVTRERGRELFTVQPIRASLDMVRDGRGVWQLGPVIVRGRRTDLPGRAPLMRMGFRASNLPEWLRVITDPQLRAVRATDGLA